MQVNVKKSTTTVKPTKREQKTLTEASDILLELGHITRQNHVSETGGQVYAITQICGAVVTSEEQGVSSHQLSRPIILW